jgi:hypothetical protein
MEFMSKALLQKARDDAIRAAQVEQLSRKNSQEKAVTVSTTSVPIPISAPKVIYTPSPTPSLTPSPPIQQIIIYPPDNTTFLIAQVEKEKALALYKAEQAERATSQEKHKEELGQIKQATKEQLEAEKLARGRSHDHYVEEIERVKQAAKERLEIEHQALIKAEELRQEELERNKQLVKEDDSLKRRYNIALEKSKVDDETIQRIIAENEMLKQELEKLRKATEKTELPVENIVVPPPYDKEQDEPEVADVILNTPDHDIPLTGDIAPESYVEDTDKCAIS